MRKLTFLLIIGMFVIGGCAAKQGWYIQVGAGPMGIILTDEAGRFTKEEIKSMISPYLPMTEPVEKEVSPEIDGEKGEIES